MPWRASRRGPSVGEEAATEDPSLTDLIREADGVWLVDPLDGTSNFVAASTDHSVMVALVEHAETVAAWMWHPASEVMAHAAREAGAWLDDERVTARPPMRDSASLRGVLKTRFLPGGIRERVGDDDGILGAASEGRSCAGLDYPDLVCGAVDFLLYWRTLPWDHVPGVLFAQEAGLQGARPDGTSYQPGDEGSGLVISHRDVWDEISEAFLGNPAG